MGLSEWWGKKVEGAGGVVKGDRRFVTTHELLFVQNWLRDAGVEVGTTLESVGGCGWWNSSDENVTVITPETEGQGHTMPKQLFKKLPQEQRSVDDRTGNVMNEKSTNAGKVILLKSVLSETRSRAIALAVIGEGARNPFRKGDDEKTMQALAVAALTNFQKVEASQISVDLVDRKIKEIKAKITKWSQE